VRKPETARQPAFCMEDPFGLRRSAICPNRADPLCGTGHTVRRYAIQAVRKGIDAFGSCRCDGWRLRW